MALRGSGPDGEPLAAWWAEIATVPVVAAEPVSLEDAGWLARHKVEFVIPAPVIWGSPANARAIAAAYRRVLDESGP